MTLKIENPKVLRTFVENFIPSLQPVYLLVCRFSLDKLGISFLTALQGHYFHF